LPFDKEAIAKTVKKVKESAGKRKFKQSIDLAINLRDIDPSKPDSKINLEVTLPKPVPKAVKICALVYGDTAVRAKEGGVNRVVEREEIEALGTDKKRAKKLASEFDFFIARADLMPLIGKNLGPVLGPRGKMPTAVNPTANLAPVIERLKRLVKVKVGRQTIALMRVGTETMKDEDIVENVQAVVEALSAKLERGDKNIRSMYLKTTMGPSIKVGAS
jgi:large subunit ribosomal protein L1